MMHPWNSGLETLSCTSRGIPILSDLLILDTLTLVSMPVAAEAAHEKRTKTRCA